MIKFRTIMLASAAMAAMISGPARADEAGASVSGGSMYNGDGPWTLGFDFTAASSWTLTGLGVWEMDGDLSQSHAVGLWDSSGNLVTSTTVSPSGLLLDGFRYTTFAPLALGAGTYRIGAADLGTQDGYYFEANVSMANGFTYNSAQYMWGSGLNRPDNVGVAGGYFGANFLIGSAVPEPATWAMMILGFGFLGAGLRASRRKTSMAISYS